MYLAIYVKKMCLFPKKCYKKLMTKIKFYYYLAYIKKCIRNIKVGFTLLIKPISDIFNDRKYKSD